MIIGMYYPFMYLSQTLVSIYTILSPYRRACVVFSVIDQLKRAKSIFIYTVYSSSEYTTATILNRMNASKNIHNLCIKLSRLYWMQQYMSGFCVCTKTRHIPWHPLYSWQAQFEIIFGTLVRIAPIVYPKLWATRITVHFYILQLLINPPHFL